MSVDLKDKYREETNKDVYSDDNVYGGSGGSYSDQYVKWLEKQVKNNDLLHSVSERFSKIEKDAKVDAEAYAVLCDSEDYGEGIRRGVMYGIDYVKKRLFNAR